jgi:hypothetical protein
MDIIQEKVDTDSVYTEQLLHEKNPTTTKSWGQILYGNHPMKLTAKNP